jgi:hypothetical protein
MRARRDQARISSGTAIPHVAALMRATAFNIIGHGHTLSHGTNQASVARMSAAICGIDFDQARTRSGTTIPHVAEFIIGRAFARPVGSCGLRRYRLQDTRYARFASLSRRLVGGDLLDLRRERVFGRFEIEARLNVHPERSKRSPHERSDMRGLLRSAHVRGPQSRMSLRSCGLPAVQ